MGQGIQVPRMYSRLKTMLKYVRIWSNLIQINAFVEAGIMDMPKTMRIFVHYIYACVRNPRTNTESWTGKVGSGLFSADRIPAGNEGNYIKSIICQVSLKPSSSLALLAS